MAHGGAQHQTADLALHGMHRRLVEVHGTVEAHGSLGIDTEDAVGDTAIETAGIEHARHADAGREVQMRGDGRYP